MDTNIQPGLNEPSMGEIPDSMASQAEVADEVDELPELEHEESGSDLPEGVAVEMALADPASGGVIAEIEAALRMALALQGLANGLANSADSSEEEDDTSARTYVAPMAICRPHDFYVNVDSAASVKVSKDRKTALCPGGHGSRSRRPRSTASTAAICGRSAPTKQLTPSI